MKRYSYPASLAIALLAFQFPATAMAFNPIEAALGYNIFTRNHVILRSGHVDGAIAAGGNLELRGETTLAMQTTGAYPGSTGASTNYSVAVEGDVIFGSGDASRVIKGYARIGNPVFAKFLDKDQNGASVMLRISPSNYNASPYLEIQSGGAPRQSAANAQQSPGIDFAAKFTNLNSAANSLLNLTSLSACNGKTAIVHIPARPRPNEQDNPSVTLTAGKINILNLTTEQLDDLNTRGSVNISPSPSATTPLVINVSNGGAEYSYNWTMMSVGGLGPSTSPYIVWNFYNAKTLNINNEKAISGSILAPLANVTRTQSTNNIDGQVVAASFDIGTGNGEIHEQPFNVDLCSTPLPVTLVSIKAKREDNYATLDWSTSQEQNSSHFEIEYSTDSKAFVKRGEVNAAGEKFSYQFRDNNELAAGANYYRLKMIDLDGTFAYSRILSVMGNGYSDVAFAYPNPSLAGAQVTVQASSIINGSAVLTILNQAGVPVGPLQSVSFSQGIATIQAPSRSGVYLIRIQSNAGTSETIRIMVK